MVSQMGKRSRDGERVEKTTVLCLVPTSHKDINSFIQDILYKGQRKGSRNRERVGNGM